MVDTLVVIVVDIQVVVVGWPCYNQTAVAHQEYQDGPKSEVARMLSSVFKWIVKLHSNKG